MSTNILPAVTFGLPLRMVAGTIKMFVNDAFGSDTEEKFGPAK